MDQPTLYPKVAIIATFRCGGTALAGAISRSYGAPLAFEPFSHPVNIPEQWRPPLDLGSHLTHHPYDQYNGRDAAEVALEHVNAIYSGFSPEGKNFIGLKTVCCSRSPTAVFGSGDALLFVSRKLIATYGSIKQENWGELHPRAFHPLDPPLDNVWPEIASKVPDLSQYWVLRWLVHSYASLLYSEQGKFVPMIWVDEWDNDLRTHVAEYLRKKLGIEPDVPLEDTLGQAPPAPIKRLLGLENKDDPTPIFWRPEWKRSQGKGYTQPMSIIADVLSKSGYRLLVELSNHIL